MRVFSRRSPVLLPCGGSVNVIINRFRVEQVVATGGMGRVFRAVDLSSGKLVAFKQLLLDSDEAEQRFEREAEILKVVDHPNIVKYVAHGKEQNAHYLVMEFIPGEPLSLRLVREGATLDEVVKIGTEIAGALAALHRQGLVHRDVKPANIMVPIGAMSPAVLVDFGLVRRVDTLASLTQTGITIGSPGYMSPEQLVGARVLTPAVDIYALGCALYVAITGHPPFPGNVAPAVYTRMLSFPPPTPMLRNAECPPELSQVVMRMLSVEPERRPIDGSQVMELLARIPLTGSRTRTKVDVRPLQVQAAAKPDSPTVEVPAVDTHFAIALASDTAEVEHQVGEPSVDVTRLADLAQAHEATHVVLADGTAVLLSRENSPRALRLTHGATCALELAAKNPTHVVALSLAAEASDTLLDRVFEMAADERMCRAVKPKLSNPVRVDARTEEVLRSQFETLQEQGRCYLISRRP
jgi:hypothetical protein